MALLLPFTISRYSQNTLTGPPVTDFFSWLSGSFGIASNSIALSWMDTQNKYNIVSTWTNMNIAWNPGYINGYGALIAATPAQNDSYPISQKAYSFSNDLSFVFVAMATGATSNVSITPQLQFGSDNSGGWIGPWIQSGGYNGVSFYQRGAPGLSGPNQATTSNALMILICTYTRSNGVMTLNYNGTTNSATASFNLTTNPLYLNPFNCPHITQGGSYTAGSPSNVAVLDEMIWTRALNSTEQSNLYNYFVTKFSTPVATLSNTPNTLTINLGGTYSNFPITVYQTLSNSTSGGTLYASSNTGSLSLTYSNAPSGYYYYALMNGVANSNTTTTFDNFVVAVGNGTNSIAYSVDGSNWTGLGTTIFTTGLNVAYNGQVWVAVGNGSNSIAYSTDGSNWTGLGTSIFPSNAGGMYLAWNGSFWLATGNTTVARSFDGNNWTSYSTSPATPSGLIWTGNAFVLTANPNNYQGYWSTNGSNWIASLYNGNFGSPGALSYNGSYMWAPYDSFGTYTFYSSNGINWGSNGIPFGLVQGAWNGSIWIASTYSASSTIAYTTLSNATGGWTGTGITNTTINSASRIVWNGKYFIAGGTGSNTIAISTVGSNTSWTGLGTSIFSTGLCNFGQRFSVTPAYSQYRFLPNQLATNAIWIDALDPNGNFYIPANGTLSTIKDKSPNGYTFTIPSGATGPSYSNDSAYFKCFSFASNTLSAPIAINLSSSMFFAVLTVPTYQGGARGFICAANASGADYQTSGGFSLDDNTYLEIAQNGSFNLNTYGSPTTRVLISWGWNGSSYSAYLNGTVASTGSYGKGTTSEFILGGRSDSSGGVSSGQKSTYTLNEFVGFSSYIGDTNRIKME